METLKEWKKFMKDWEYSKEAIQMTLEHQKEKIKWLENIYQSDGKTGLSFSEEFKNAAVRERNHASVILNACYSLLRELK